MRWVAYIVGLIIIYVIAPKEAKYEMGILALLFTMLVYTILFIVIFGIVDYNVIDIYNGINISIKFEK